MIAIMNDGLELGVFKEEDGKLKLVLHDGVKKSWLPYIFELALEHGTDMRKIIEIWKKERVFPKNRLGSRRMLKELGLKRYNVDKICEITRCSLITDPYWLVYEPEDRYYINSIRGQKGVTTYNYNSLGIENEEDFIWRK